MNHQIDSPVVYLSGPMRGIAEFNFPAFDTAAARLELLGYTVYNPAKRDRELGFDPTGMAGTDQELEAAGFNSREALAGDLLFICSAAEIVVVLDGWEDSKGAFAEVATAAAIGVPVRPITDLTTHIGDIR